jgi:ketosteroid isomerase-like protein
MADSQAEIRALVEERAQAMRDKDSERALATLADDVIAFELAPPLALGPEQVRDRATLDGWFALWSGPLEVEIRDVEIAASGDVAWCFSLNRLAGTRGDGRRVDFWMRSTLGLRRIDGQWKIAHAHTSVPFNMDGSYRAATDLSP